MLIMLKELNILRQLLPTLPQRPEIALGPGDDCAAIDLGGEMLLLAAADQLVGGVHYFSDRTSPAAAGRKLLKRNLSDIAAMGGVPAWALLTVAVDGRSEDWVLAYCRGVAEAAAEYGVALCGGDLAALPAGRRTEVGSLTILGRIERSRLIRRSGAQPGDLVWVTGEFGNSLASGHHLDFKPRLGEGQFLAERGLATAMLDVSDGLLLDAERLAAASQVSVRLNPAAVPRRFGAGMAAALGEGEDYELLFTAPAGRRGELERNWPPESAPLHCIGEVTAGEPGVFEAGGDRRLKEMYRTGYEH